MKFWKMHGAGNDFIVINNIEERILHSDIPVLVKSLCRRRLSVGADGFMLVENPSVGSGADFSMLFYNLDGSIGEMCGNGARCICRYGYENGLSGETQKVETTAGVVTGVRISESDYKVRLNDPCNISENIIEYDGVFYEITYVELGNPGIPHVAVQISELRNYDEKKLLDLARFIRNYNKYPKGANVNFYEKIGDDHLFLKTYERGVEGFTYACGTGTGSVVYILTLRGEVSGQNVKADMLGGTLKITVENPNDMPSLYLTGPSFVVYKAETVEMF